MMLNACKEGDLKTVTKLLNTHNNHFPASIIEGDYGNRTALHWACQFEHPEIVSLLIKGGASLDIANTDDGCTPLHEACMRETPSIVHELLINGADANAKTKDGRSPMELACAMKRGEIILELLKHASKTQSRDDFQLLLENARAWFEKVPNPLMPRLPLSVYLTKDVMDSLERNVRDNNVENEEKGAR